jgi:hypothetical protein
MIRIIAKLFAVAVVVVVAAFLHVAPVQAGQDFAYVSSTGSDSYPCTAAQPCATIIQAIVSLNSEGGSGQVSCLNSPSIIEQSVGFGESFTIDCTGVIAQSSGSSSPILQFDNPNQFVKIRNLTFSGVQATNGAILVTGSGTLILENCVFENIADGPALDIEPIGPLNLVIRNSRISNGGTVAIVLKPSAGGSINATFDHVTVTNNAGGGIRLDTTNGLVTADVTDSVITNNTGNGLSAQGGAGGAAMLSIHNSVIAKNGAAGVNATGTNGAALVDTTLLDTNGSATSVASGGRIITYGNNRIVGPAGTGFTGTASLQ